MCVWVCVCVGVCVGVCVCGYVCVWVCECVYVYVRSVLGAFATLQEATLNFMSVCPAAWNNLAPSGRIFIKFDI